MSASYSMGGSSISGSAGVRRHHDNARKMSWIYMKMLVSFSLVDGIMVADFFFSI